MREPVRVLYYPDMLPAELTLKKAILFFDELHIMDRPSLTVTDRAGSIGMASPMRQFEHSFRDGGFPVYVHDQPRAPGYRDQLRADLNEPRFLSVYQEGLRTSEPFRSLQVGKGNYGTAGSEVEVAAKLMEVDLATAIPAGMTPIDLLEDETIPPFDMSDGKGEAWNLVNFAAHCSAKMNMSLTFAAREGFVPLADAAPYGRLLHAKYVRAADIASQMVVDLSFAAFDRLISDDRLDKLTLKDAMDYRRQSAGERADFLEQLAFVAARADEIPIDADYPTELQKIVDREILPAAQAFRNRLAAIYDNLFGSLGKGVFGMVGGATIFGSMSLSNLLNVGMAGGAYLGKALIDAEVAKRAATRECAVSYILGLER